MRPSAKAFTFIELMFVMLIVAVLAGMTLPRLKGSFLGMQRDGAARDVYYLARFLQESAMAQGSVYSLRIDTAARKMVAATRTSAGDSDIKAGPARPKTLPDGITASFQPSQTERVFFYPDGSIEPEGNIIISSQQGSRSLHLTGASGEIRIE